MDARSAVMLATLVVVVAAVIWFDRRCLDDLARTPDRALRHFPRNTWAMIIVFAFPIGPLMYLMYAKGPRA
jgi:hypothetical protein